MALGPGSTADSAGSAQLNDGTPAFESRHRSGRQKIGQEVNRLHRTGQVEEAQEVHLRGKHSSW